MGAPVPWTIQELSVHTDAYAEHRTGAEMQRLLRHGHPIPVGRGYTSAYVAEHFPGWSWNRLLTVCRATNIVDQTSAGGQPLRCDPRVRAIHFNDERSFAVEWNDGTVSLSGPTTQ